MSHCIKKMGVEIKIGKSLLFICPKHCGPTKWIRIFFMHRSFMNVMLPYEANWKSTMLLDLIKDDQFSNLSKDNLLVKYLTCFSTRFLVEVTYY